jgi:hypothetical protein
MSEWTNLISAFGWCLFGIAAVLAAVFFLRMVSRFDRIIALAEKGAVGRLPLWLAKLVDR